MQQFEYNRTKDGETHARAHIRGAWACAVGVIDLSRAAVLHIFQ